MIRVAIVEDDAEVQGVLQEYVRRYTRQYGTEFEVSVFADGVDILEDYRAMGVGAEKFGGVYDNTEIYHKLAELTKVQ